MQGVYALLTDDVAWANGMEGTHIHGKDAIRDYWTHQSSVIDPHVEPLKIARVANGSLIVDVHPVVKNLGGQTIIDETVKHAFRLDGGRVRRFDTQSDTQLTAIHSAT
jgi:SnoaL-like domain